MSKVYLILSGAPDQLLGHVSEEGKIVRSQSGPDTEIGHVDLAKGHVYQKRLGADKKVGSVDLESGRVYVNQFGPDEYVGQVEADGSLRRHVAGATDKKVGKVEPFISYAHSAGAMLLLVWPALEDTAQDDKAASTKK